MKSEIKNKLLNANDIEEFKIILKQNNIIKLPKDKDIDFHLNKLLSTNIDINKDELYREMKNY